MSVVLDRVIERAFDLRRNLSGTIPCGVGYLSALLIKAKLRAATFGGHDHTIVIGKRTDSFFGFFELESTRTIMHSWPIDGSIRTPRHPNAVSILDRVGGGS